MSAAIKKHLVDDAGSFWRWLSVQYQFVSALVLIALQLGPIMPEQFRQAIPQPWGTIITVVWFGLWLLSRLKQQKGVPGGK
jgi:hypothetical protein